MYTKKQLAERLNISISTIDRLMIKGMPYLKIADAVRFEYEEVVAWIKSNQKR